MKFPWRSCLTVLVVGGSLLTGAACTSIRSTKDSQSAAAIGGSCSQESGASIPAALPDTAAANSRAPFGFAKPETQGVSARKLVELANWVSQGRVPIFSFLVSKNGQVVFELTTSGLGRDEAHYLMSVTKSVTSAAVGAAIDRGLIASADTPVSSLIPAREFTDEKTRAAFAAVTLRDVLGMSALDAPVPPHLDTAETRARFKEFYFAPDRLKVALAQKTVAQPGVDFQYSDVTPQLAVGAVEYAAKKTLLDFAKETLFAPMGFESEEWMHEDPAGFDNGAHGLRLRPIDMQKLGVLYLDGGCWNGHRLLSRAWVETSFTPWLRSRPANKDPDYGWYWWKDWFDDGYTAHVANGWQGQRIAVFPKQKVVVTMTAAIRDGSENRVFAELVNKFVIPAVEGGPDASPYDSDMALDLALNRAKMQNRILRGLELRMIPSRTAKESHHAFSAAP